MLFCVSFFARVGIYLLVSIKANQPHFIDVYSVASTCVRAHQLQYKN